MTSNNLPPGLAAIVEQAMEKAYKPSKERSEKSGYFQPPSTFDIRNAITSAVQEAAQWGKKNADLMVEE